MTDYAHVTNSLKDMSGWMRIVRSGSTIKAYNYSFGKWILVNTERVGQTDVSILLQASAFHYGFEDRSVKVLIGYVNNKSYQMAAEQKSTIIYTVVLWIICIG